MTAIVVAAGPGTRLGAGRPKGFVELDGVPLLVHALRAVAAAPAITAAVVVAPADMVAETEALLERHGPTPCPTRVVAGGDERQDSVRHGLAAVAPGTELVAIHDAARPFVSRAVVDEVIALAARHGAAIVAVPATDTVKHVHPEGWIESTAPRERVWLAQTPQVFRTDLIRRAHAQPASDAATDDAVLVERLGVRVYVARGNAENRKITTPEDLRWATWLLAQPAGSR